MARSERDAVDATRRSAFKAVVASALIAPGAGIAAPACVNAATARPAWGVGPEGRRRADRGDGTFLNPIVAGDHADPTVLKDGGDYYMTCSSFASYPGVVIRHSRDLVNWSPICAALTTNVGSVWAMDLVKHDGRYFIYIPANGKSSSSIFVSLNSRRPRRSALAVTNRSTFAETKSFMNCESFWKSTGRA